MLLPHCLNKKPPDPSWASEGARGRTLGLAHAPNYYEIPCHVQKGTRPHGHDATRPHSTANPQEHGRFVTGFAATLRP